MYAIATLDRAALDRAEGLGFGYDADLVTVQTTDGSVEALTYVATSKGVECIEIDVDELRGGAPQDLKLF